MLTATLALKYQLTECGTTPKNEGVRLRPLGTDGPGTTSSNIHSSYVLLPGQRSRATLSQK
jgi:hypothetical protein